MAEAAVEEIYQKRRAKVADDLKKPTGKDETFLGLKENLLMKSTKRNLLTMSQNQT